MENEEVEYGVITPEEQGKRLDRILADRYQDIRSRTYFQRLIEGGHVTINGEAVKKRLQPQVGDEVEIVFVLTPEIALLPENIPLDRVFEDDHILVVNKPPGMVVHPAPGHWTGTFVHALLYHCQGIEKSGDEWRPGIVHRLDKDTSGILIAAKTVVAHQKLVQLFSSRQVTKHYMAICLGNPGEGEIRAPIGRHLQQRKQMAVVEGGREAVTRYRTLATKGDLSLVELQLVTGRTHQARVHMRHRGTPVLGDVVYGSSAANQRYGLNRQLLHARSVRLRHPIHASELYLQAPLPVDMQIFVDKIR